LHHRPDVPRRRWERVPLGRRGRRARANLRVRLSLAVWRRRPRDVWCAMRTGRLGQVLARGRTHRWPGLGASRGGPVPLVVEVGAPDLEAALDGAHALADDEPEEPEDDDAEHRASDIEELRLERDVEAKPDVSREDLRAHDTHKRAAGADADAADDERERARQDDRAESEPRRPAERPRDVEMP